MLKYLFIPVIIISSCSQKPADETTMNAHSLKIFPLGYQMEFIGTNSNDQIALLLKREKTNLFKCRIELLKKWKGVPLDYGTVKIQRLDSDSTYFFEGGNSDCNVLIKILGNRRSLAEAHLQH